MKRKVLFVYGSFPLELDGGADYCRNLFLAALESGHDAHVLTSDTVKLSGEDEATHGKRIHRLIPQWGEMSSRGRHQNTLQAFFAAKNFDYTIVIYPSSGERFSGKTGQRYLFPGYISQLKGSGKLHMIMFTPFPPRPKLSDLHCAAKMILTYDKVLCEDAQMARFGQRFLPFVGKKFSWIPMGSTIDSEPKLNPHCNKKMLRKKYNMDPDAKYISFFGYWYRSKGIDVLLKALSLLLREGNNELGNTRLIFVGGRPTECFGPYERKMLSMANQLGLANRIEIKGNVDAQVVYETLFASDVYALPCKRVFTGRSSLLPAIRLGLPLVMSNDNNNSAGLILNNEHALFSKPGNPNSLTKVLTRILLDPDLAAQLGQNLKGLNEQYQWKYALGRLLH